MDKTVLAYDVPTVRWPNTQNQSQIPSPRPGPSTSWFPVARTCRPGNGFSFNSIGIRPDSPGDE